MKKLLIQYIVLNIFFIINNHAMIYTVTNPDMIYDTKWGIVEGFNIANFSGQEQKTIISMVMQNQLNMNSNQGIFAWLWAYTTSFFNASTNDDYAYHTYQQDYEYFENLHLPIDSLNNDKPNKIIRKVLLHCMKNTCVLLDSDTYNPQYRLSWSLYGGNNGGLLHGDDSKFWTFACVKNFLHGKYNSNVYAIHECNKN